MTARRRIEIQSHGVDEFHQGFGTDPFGSQSWLGLRVPFLATTSFRNRYLFMGAAFSVAEGSRARIIGYRQLYNLGCIVENVGPRPQGVLAPRQPAPGLHIPLEFEVETPSFAFVDGTVTWHFRRLGPPNAQGLPLFTPSNLTDLESARRGVSMTPALLYDTMTVPAGNPYYTNLTAYTPPNGGRPYGVPLTDAPELSDIYGLQTKWRDADAWGSLDVEVEGPDTVCAFISVAQTNPVLSQFITPPLAEPPGTTLTPPEFNFLTMANFGFAVPVYNWRVGVSLIVEVDSRVSEIRSRGEP